MGIGGIKRWGHGYTTIYLEKSYEQHEESFSLQSLEQYGAGNQGPDEHCFENRRGMHGSTIAPSSAPASF